MTTLRGVLGAVAALTALGWLALVALGSGFRRSFGASENGPLVALLPVTVALLVAASLLWPDRRWLMHLVAALMAALLARWPSTSPPAHSRSRHSAG